MTDKLRFGREYQVIIGVPERVIQSVIPSSILAPRFIEKGVGNVNLLSPITTDGDYIDLNTIPPEWFQVTGVNGNGIQMTAEIRQTKSTGFPCVVTFDNLPQESINKIRTDGLLIVRGGYSQPLGDFVQVQGVGVGREQLSDLFVGQITQVVSSEVGPTRKTKIICGEALLVKKNSKVSKSFPIGTTRKQVLDTMIGYMKDQGIPLGRFSVTEANSQEWDRLQKPYLMGYTVKGFLMEELDSLCTAFGLRNYMSLGKLYIEAASAPVGNTIFVVNNSKIHGKVNVVKDTTGGTSNKNGNANSSGIQFTVWLDGNISVDKIARLDGVNDDVDGEYYIESVKHKCDFESKKNWTTTVTAKRIGG